MLPVLSRAELQRVVICHIFPPTRHRTIKSVRITDNLYTAAEAASAIMHRSIAMQLEHWAILGQKLEAQHMDSVRNLTDGEDPTLRAAKAISQQGFVRAVKRGKLANTAGMFFADDFFKNVSVNTAKHVL